jgi:hypothetical protein
MVTKRCLPCTTKEPRGKILLRVNRACFILLFNFGEDFGSCEIVCSTSSLSNLSLLIREEVAPFKEADT